MLRRLFYIALVLLLFTSCGHRSQEMSEALLRAEEMNRNYQSMDTLKGMEQVADYYRPLLGRSQRYMRALYMLGCVYRDRGDAPMALHYYQEAVSQADTTDADCDFHTLCRVYGQMAVLFQAQRSPQLELEAERKAYNAAMKAKDTLAAISYYEYMAGAYYALGKKDTALAIVENTISLYTKKNEKASAAAEMGVASDFYIEKKDLKRADSLLKQYEAYSGFFDKDGEITPGRESYYYTKGLYYQGVQKLDSALYFYRKLLHPRLD
ncbi:MAG: tetratricopeptide repeat protein, partial [Prevotella sp.]|nr:tetratricopeptide repeat protein [Prevotella sp.]